MNESTDLQLIKQAQSGDIEARNALLLRHQGFVWMMVREALGPARKRFAEEHFASGIEGLIRAIEGFDPAKAGSLLTYAGIGIKSRVWRDLARDTPVTRQGSRPKKAGDLARWKQAGRACEIGPIAGDCGETTPVDAALIQLDMAEIVTRYVKALNPIERSVLHLRYHVGMPRDEAGRELGGLSRAQVAHIESNAISKMRDLASADGHYQNGWTEGPLG